MPSCNATQAAMLVRCHRPRRRTIQYPAADLSGNRRHLLIPPPRNAQAGWHVVSESERGVGWGCKKRPPPRFASAFPPHCSLTLAGEGWERPARRHGVLDAPPSRGMTACFVRRGMGRAPRKTSLLLNLGDRLGRAGVGGGETHLIPGVKRIQRQTALHLERFGWAAGIRADGAVLRLPDRDGAVEP